MKSLIKKETKIYLADDHRILREGLKLLLSFRKDFTVIGEARDGKTALKEILKYKPDVAILDISMPEMSGIEVARNLKETGIKIIILSSYDSKEYIKESIKQDIYAYVLKEEAGNELINTIDMVIKGKRIFSERIIEILDEIDIQNDSKLSEREMETLKLVVEGKSHKEIGKLLGISENTAKIHKANLMKKLGIHKSTDLVKYAMNNKII